MSSVIRCNVFISPVYLIFRMCMSIAVADVCSVISSFGQ